MSPPFRERLPFPSCKESPECCGIHNFSGFRTYFQNNPFTKEEWGRYKRLFIEYMQYCLDEPYGDDDEFDKRGDCILFTASLTDNQLDWQHGLYKKLLDQLGFYEVVSFINNNTGNTVHVFHYIKEF